MRMKPYLSLIITFTSGGRNNTRYGAPGLPSLSVVPYEHVKYVVLMLLFYFSGYPKAFPKSFSQELFPRAFSQPTALPADRLHNSYISINILIK